MKKLLRIFTTCMYLSAFTYGGGYVIVPLMKRKFVDELGWLEEKEVTDMIAVAQSSPGAIAVNTALLLGFKVRGALGALAALFGIILPPIVIVSVVSVFYGFFYDNQILRAILKGMQAGVAALVCEVAFKLAFGVVKKKEPFLIVIMAASFLLIFFLEINVAYIILACVVLGVLGWAIGAKKSKKAAAASQEKETAQKSSDAGEEIDQ